MYRTLVTLVSLIFSTLLFIATPSYSQPYPSQPIKIIVPTPPGGMADVLARIFADKLMQAGHVAVVENKTGAGGAIAADFVAKSAPDGYTVYLGFHNTQAILPHLTKLAYDPAKDFQAVTLLTVAPSILIANPSTNLKTLKDVIAFAKANPGKLSYASQGNGSSAHIVGEQLKEVAGVDITHVPYRGQAPQLRDLLAGHVALSIDMLPNLLPQIDAKAINVIAVAAPERLPALSDIPTFKELGMPQIEGGPWFGLLVAAGTPKSIVDWLYQNSRAAFLAPNVQARFKNQSLDFRLNTPDEFTAFIASESNRWGEIIRRAKISLN